MLSFISAINLAIMFLLTGLATCVILRLASKKSWSTISAVAAGFIWIALFILRYQERPYVINAFEQHVITFIQSLKYFSFGKSFTPLSACPMPEYSQLYYFIEILLSILAPACTTVVVLSWLQKVGRVRLHVMFWRPVYYFSEVNERSVTLAQSIWKKESNGPNRFHTPILVFCKPDSQSADSIQRFHSELQKLNAIIYDQPIEAIKKINPRSRNVKVFLMNNDETGNMSSALQMREWILSARHTNDGAPHPENDLMLFSADPSAELLFDKLLSSVGDASMNLHLINDTRYTAQELLREHPLYQAAALHKTNEISVLVVGCGNLGNQILKTAMLCGMMDNYKLDVHVIDSNAKTLEEQFVHDFPFLYHENPSIPFVTPKFHQAAICTSEFDEALYNHCQDCNYIVIATGDDHLNVTTAQYLQRWYLRQAIRTSNDKLPMPLVYAAVRNPNQHAILKNLENDHFRLFANNMHIYSVEGILNCPLEKAASFFHYFYETRGKCFKWDKETQLACKHALLRTPVATQWSNQIVALHSLYKFQDLLYWYQKTYPTGNGPVDLSKLAQAPTISDTFSIFVQLIRLYGDDFFDLEHRRWVLCHALMGWDVYPLSNMEQLFKSPHFNLFSHKNVDAKLHGCMIPSSQLLELSQLLQTHTGATPDFIESDRLMCLTSAFAWLELKNQPELTQCIMNCVLKDLKLDDEEIPDSQEALHHICAVVTTPGWDPKP